MSDIAPEFKSGNGFFVKALNSVVAYAKGHGINTAGLPGWSWSPDGWVPPESRSSDEVLKPWDLVPVPDSDDFELYAPEVFIDTEDIEGTATITNTPFTPVAEEYLVAKIDDLDTFDITLDVLGTWTSHPSAYEFESFSPYDFASAKIPLWRFYEENDDGRVKISEGVWGRKLVPSRPVIVEYILVKVPGEDIIRYVPRFS